MTGVGGQHRRDPMPLLAGGGRQMQDMPGCENLYPPFEGERFKKTLSCCCKRGDGTFHLRLTLKFC
jgi:hypothetical protein